MAKLEQKQEELEFQNEFYTTQLSDCIEKVEKLQEEQKAQIAEDLKPKPKPPAAFESSDSADNNLGGLFGDDY